MYLRRIDTTSLAFAQSKVSEHHRSWGVSCLNKMLIGFYGVTYNIGFRDDFNPSTSQIVTLVSELEARADPMNAIRVIAEMKAVSERTSHM